MIDEILSQVYKPGRYIGGEWNVARKDFEKSAIKFALCFPDLYEIGMSNLGMRIIYGILNDIEDVSCERVFSVHIDMEKVLRQRGQEIFSLESKRSIREFDILGFSLGYELNYTNVLNILDLGSIPFNSSHRDQNYPLVIAGGPSVLNPEPMSEFFDLFVIGEAEEAVVEITAVYRTFKERFKAKRISKQDLLIEFSHIQGVYVPSLYEVRYNSQNQVEVFRPKIEGVPARIKKCFIKDLNTLNCTLDWLVPYIQIIHDRINLEIMRGCPNRCRFCQARIQYFPFRQRELKNILNSASDMYKNTGYEEVALCGLSVSDYSQIEELLKALINLFKEKAVSVSLPSIKPKTMVGSLSSLIATIKKTGLTFAPEAATEKLRRVIAKDFDMQEFLRAIESAYRAGYRHIKLYFMIGLPHEEESDLDGIFDFATSVSESRKKINLGLFPSGSYREFRKGLINQKPAGVNISVNTLIPKPHTPFQWLKMQDIDSIKYKYDYLKNKITKNKRLKLSFSNPYMSFLEGVLSRGDRRLSKVIVGVFQKGARFDAWSNNFEFNIWQEAFNEAGIDPNFYLKERSEEETFPWDFIDIGISKESLLNEFRRAQLTEC